MELIKRLILVLAFGFILVGCAAFSYRYYGLDAVSYDGKLLGPKPEDDISFMFCKPDETVKGKCVVMKADDFFRMKQDYNETKQRLIECQGGR